MAENLLRRLNKLLPAPQVLVGRVVAHHDDDTSSIELPSSLGLTAYGGNVAAGSIIRARGRGVSVGSNAFVRAGVVESEAPASAPVEIVVGSVTPGCGLEEELSDTIDGTWALPAAFSESGVQPALRDDGYTFDVPSGISEGEVWINPALTIFSRGGQSTGRRYFQIEAREITYASIMGFIVGRTDDELQLGMYGWKESDRWIALYDGAGGEAVQYTDYYNAFDEANFTAADWPPIVSGSRIGFALDLDAGRLDSINVDGVPLSLDVDDPDAFAAVNAWPPNQIVRPFINADANSFEPFGTFTLVISEADLTHRPAGYEAWGTP